MIKKNLNPIRSRAAGSGCAAVLLCKEIYPYEKNLQSLHKTSSGDQVLTVHSGVDCPLGRIRNGWRSDWADRILCFCEL